MNPRRKDFHLAIPRRPLSASLSFMRYRATHTSPPHRIVKPFHTSTSSAALRCGDAMRSALARLMCIGWFNLKEFTCVETSSSKIFFRCVVKDRCYSVRTKFTGLIWGSANKSSSTHPFVPTIQSDDGSSLWDAGRFFVKLLNG